MRRLHLGLEVSIPRDTFSRLSHISAGGVLFPGLEWLRWYIEETDIPSSCFHLFLPPKLKTVVLYTRHIASDIPRDHVVALVHVISFLTSSLVDLTFKCGQRRAAVLEDTISSFVLRHGSSLRRFDSDLPLSEAAIHCLVQLPNLRSWVGTHGPPRTLPLVAFPSLEELYLEPAALPWLHLIVSHEEDVIRKGFVSATPRTSIRETLKFLECPRVTIIDSTFLSSVAHFRNLVGLRVEGDCSDAEGCVSRLTDDDVKNLAAALPRLKTLQLGRPCRSNSCNTTVASLMSISVNCIDLTVLEVHFNFLDIVRDLRLLLDRSSERDKPKCKLSYLVAGYVSLDVQEVDVETVAMGLRAIFPCLARCPGWGKWSSVQAALKPRI